jgi:hypothetical protein
MKNSQIAERFAEGATRGKGSNMFIDGNTIYSYGYHFPIAIRVEGGYLWNRNSYSNSTAKHKNHVAHAIGYKTLISLNTECMRELSGYNPSPKIAQVCKDRYIDQLKNEIATTEDKLTRARSEWKKEDYNRQIEDRKTIIKSLKNY